MDIRVRKIMYALVGFLLLNLLSNCDPETTFCNEATGGIVEDAMTLTPLQTTYQKGDEVVLKLFINADEPYFERNIYESTQDETVFLILDFSDLVTDNELIFVKGSQGEYPFWFNMPYNSVTGQYEFEVKIKLNKVGVYSQSAGANIYFEGIGGCNHFLLSTNIAGRDTTNGNIEFEVLP